MHESGFGRFNPDTLSLSPNAIHHTARCGRYFHEISRRDGGNYCEGEGPRGDLATWVGLDVSGPARRLFVLRNLALGSARMILGGDPTMYCPQCAAQNLEGVKFCRACGTNLETVALALAGQPDRARISRDKAQNTEVASTGLEKTSAGLKKIARATGLLGASALVGAALALFSHDEDWIVLWMIFAGWMACLGMISLTSGVAALIESRHTLKTERARSELVGANSPPGLGEGPLATPLTPAESAPPSVTEYTTKTLSKRRPNELL